MNELRQDAEKFADFLVRNYHDAAQWMDPVGMMSWYISHCFVAVVCCEHGHIMALGSARPVERPGLGVLPYYFNENGTCLHIDLLIDNTGDERATLALRDICKMRFPQCRTVTMFRHFEGKLHVYPVGRFWKGLEKIKIAKRKRKQYVTEQT